MWGHEGRQENPSWTSPRPKYRIQATFASVHPFDRLHDPTFDGTLLCIGSFNRAVGSKDFSVAPDKFFDSNLRNLFCDERSRDNFPAKPGLVITDSINHPLH